MENSRCILIDTDIGHRALCGDVAYTFKNIEGDIPIGGVNPQEWHAAMLKLSGSDVLLLGHDPDIVKRRVMPTIARLDHMAISRNTGR